jgi:DNA-binding LacI/PurR family transcriptional regulator
MMDVRARMMENVRQMADARRQNKPAPAVMGKREPLYKGLYDAVRRRIELGQLRPGTRAPSEADLIAEFRVSSTTARRCLNELAQAGYVERVQGKGTFVSAPPVLGRHQQMGVLYNDLFNLADIFLSRVLSGIANDLEREDFHPILLGSNPIRRSASARDAMLELVRRHDLEAILVLSPLPLPWFEGVLQKGLPVTAINFAYADDRIGCAVPNVEDGRRELVGLLRSHGHRRIVNLSRAFPPDLLEGVQLSRPRLANGGFDDVEWRNETFRYFGPDETRRIIDRQMSGPNPPTAFVTYGYELALEVRGALKAAGLRIPQDVSLVFQGVPAGPTDLSGQIVPVEEMGQWAAQATREAVRIGGPAGPAVRKVFDIRLHEGDSLGPTVSEGAGAT